MSEEGEMTHGPASSEDNAAEGKFPRIALFGTIDRNHSVLLPFLPPLFFFFGAANRRDDSKLRALLFIFSPR